MDLKFETKIPLTLLLFKLMIIMCPVILVISCYLSLQSTWMYFRQKLFQIFLLVPEDHVHQQAHVFLVFLRNLADPVVLCDLLFLEDPPHLSITTQYPSADKNYVLVQLSGTIFMIFMIFMIPSRGKSLIQGVILVASYSW